MKIVNVAKDFSEFPAGRYHPKDGHSTGELFRSKFLVPSLESSTPIEVQLDGPPAYPSSFLEEAFGGLIRAGFTQSQINSLVTLTYRDQYYEQFFLELQGYIQEASASLAVA